MSCPEAELRSRMSDAEFWEHVLLRPHEASMERYDPGYYETPLGPMAEPCEECGSVGACAWDSEGRPLIHPVNMDDD